MFFILSLLLGCGSEDKITDTASMTTGSCTEGETITAVFSVFSYARNDNGVAWGFDLDDVTSDINDDEGCNKPDVIDPLGNEGIDNAFANLIPALESTEAIALESLVQQAINNGNLLLMVEVTGVDDFQNDDCVTVGLYRAQGIPLIGTDGFLLDGQSFARDVSLPHSVIENVALVDGHIVAKPLDIQLPVQVLDEALDFHLSEGGVDIRLNDDGGMIGFFGGALPIYELTDIATLPDVNLPDAIVNLLASAADLYPNEEGTCEYLSLAFQYEAIPAHFYAE